MCYWQILYVLIKNDREVKVITFWKYIIGRYHAVINFAYSTFVLRRSIQLSKD